MNAPTVRRNEAPTFDQVMADQLARAPWFLISIALHALCLIALAVLVHREADPEPRRTVSIDLAALEDPIEIDEFATEEVVELEHLEARPIVEDVLEDPVPEDEPFEFVPLEPIGRTEPLHADLFDRLRGTGQDKASGDDPERAETAEFQKRVRHLRRSGLDVVFCFDSTYSMAPMIEETKGRIASMIAVLEELVPNTRVGLVTYRDDDELQDYVTRALPLDSDPFRVVNFMHTVYAAGGGDVPEAVLDGLREAAFGMRWRKGAERVIVLAGDAPAKPGDADRIAGVLRRFVQTSSNASVHTITTWRDEFGADPDTQTCFEEIARLGRGTSIALADESVVLREILSLALGWRFRRDVGKITARVEEQRTQISARARDIVHREDVDALRSLVLADPPDEDVVRACARSESPRVARALADIASSRRASERSRHAAAFALQRILGLHAPPVPPESGAPMSKRKAELIDNMIERRLR